MLDLCHYLSESLIPHFFKDLEQPAREVVHLDGLRQGLSKELPIVRHLVHQFVQNRLRRKRQNRQL